MTPPRRVVLCGSSGSGKSTVGRILAQRLGAPLVDVDDVIAGRAPDAGVVLRERGSEVFRTHERTVLDTLCAEADAGLLVLALGGGSVSDAGFAPQPHDLVVHLDVEAGTAWERIAADRSDRPLAPDRESLSTRIQTQRPAHESISNITIDAGRSAHDIAAEIASQLRAVRGTPYIAAGALGHLPAVVRSSRHAKVAVVWDEALGEVGASVVASLTECGIGVAATDEMAVGAWTKDLATVEALLASWQDAGLDRDCLVVALGGGTLLDVAGLAASLHLRGVNWLAVPTTLVAQVDAAIGGKTAVDFRGARNRIGTFHPPLAIIADPILLETLPASEIAAGMAELWKAALLEGPQSWEPASALGPDEAPHSRAFRRALGRAASFKSAVVAADPTEQGARAQLNLGHTFAHALESATGIGHGATVARGLLAALSASERLYGLDPEVRATLKRAMERFGLAADAPIAWHELERWLHADKKRAGGRTRWVLLRSPGAWELADGADPEVAGAVRDAWEELPMAPLRSTGEVHEVMVLLGVNLADLGERPEQVYGRGTLSELRAILGARARELGLRCDVRASDDLARFISAIREARHRSIPVIVNPGAWTHTEYAIADALEPHPAPVIEVHLSEPRDRETWRHRSVLEARADLRIAGRGAAGFVEALEWLARQGSDPSTPDSGRPATRITP